jgi:hypothetical protein
VRAVFIAAFLAAAFGVTAAHAAGIKSYKTESGAQKHCPNDEVVWGSFTSSVHAFHVKGSKSYGTTKNGAYACRKELEVGGWHAAANNQ